MKKINIDWFLISLFFAVAISFTVPEIGANDGPFYLEHIAKWGVFVIFFLHGAKLSYVQIKFGISAWRLHLAAQTIVFIVFPLIGAAIYFSAYSILSDPQRFGIFFLCAVSSTISSSVILTGMAEGNVAGAVFSATVSGILGIFITPILISQFYAANGEIDTLQAIIDVMRLILLPLFIGQIFRPFIKGILDRYKSTIANIDRIIIVLIVFVAFCNSNKAQIFAQIEPSSLAIIFLIVAVLFGTAITISHLVAKLIGLDRADTIAAVFVGSTKSLANGVPIASVLFFGNSNIGIFILPLMLYHPLQLAACAWLARRWANSGANKIDKIA